MRRFPTCDLDDLPGQGRSGVRQYHLSGVSLPGSHAGTFNLDAQAFDARRASSCTDWVAKHSSQGTEFNRWSQTQDETILDQLDQGIRFIDLQVAYNGAGSALDGWRVVQSQFSTPSNVTGGGNATMAEVAYDDGGQSRSFATASIDQIVQQGGGGHNVVVLLPSTVEDKQVLSTKYNVEPVFTHAWGPSSADRRRPSR